MSEPLCSREVINLSRDFEQHVLHSGLNEPESLHWEAIHSTASVDCDGTGLCSIGSEMGGPSKPGGMDGGGLTKRFVESIREEPTFRFESALSFLYQVNTTGQTGHLTKLDILLR
jgi:hypothetical protein